MEAFYLQSDADYVLQLLIKLTQLTIQQQNEINKLKQIILTHFKTST